MSVSVTVFAGIDYSYDENSVSFNISKSDGGNISYTDKISLAILKPGKEFNNAAGADYKYIDAYNQSENDVNLGYIFEDNDWGVHKIRLTVTHKDSTSFFEEYSFYYNSQEDVDALVNDMRNVKADGVNVCLNKYANEKNVLNIGEISEIDSENIYLSPEACTAYVITKDIFAGSEDYEFKTAIDVLNSLKVSMMVDALMNKDSESFCSTYEKYVRFANGLIESEVNPRKYFEFFKSFKNSIADSNDLVSALKKASLLTMIDNGTAGDVIEAVTKYGSAYGIDIEQTKEKGVAPGDIAARIDKSDASKYIENFGTVYKSIENSLIPQNPGVPDSVSNNRGGGGGSTGGGNYTVSAPPEKPVNEEQQLFTDVSPQMWAYDYIKDLKQRGYINGYEDGSFRPDSSIRREEFIKLVIEALQIKTVESKDLLFIDCDKEQWYYPYIKIAYSNNIINGKGDYTIGIGEDITREDMAVIICRAAGIKTVNSEASFTDNEEFSGYSVSAVNAAAANGIIKGYEDGSFKPKNKATRAETAVIIYRVINTLNE